MITTKCNQSQPYGYPIRERAPIDHATTNIIAAMKNDKYSVGILYDRTIMGPIVNGLAWAILFRKPLKVEEYM